MEWSGASGSRGGLGTPREAMRLVGNPLRPEPGVDQERQDHTFALEVMTYQTPG